MRVCIVVPCYNEGHRLNELAFLTFLNENPQISFCFVNDGSSDDTIDKLLRLKSKNERVLVLNNPHNKGKAETVRNGINHVVKEFDIVGFFDADLATPLNELSQLIHIIGQNQYDAVFASRILRLGSVIQRRFKRHLFGRLFATIIGTLFGIKAYDTQCGAKVFRREIAEKIFAEPFVSKWIFDVELLIRMDYRQDHHNLFEYPLRKWVDVAGSKITFKDTLRIPLEILKLYKAYR